MRHRNPATNQALERRRRIEKALLNGHTNQHELALRFGVSQSLISKEVSAIQDRWADSGGSLKRKREKRIKQLENVLQQTLEAFEKSKESQETVATNFRSVPCPDCRGKGSGPEGDCADCNGTGRVTIEEVVRTVRGQAGENAFLATATKTIMDIAKLEGLIVNPKAIKAKTAFVQVNSVTTDNPYLHAPEEVLLEAREALQRLQKSIRSPASEAIIELLPNNLGGQKDGSHGDEESDSR